MKFRIGLISDTHGLLRPAARAFLSGCDHIVHAGDICDAAVLDALRLLAPLTAVRGNNDHGAWAQRLRDAESIRLGGIGLHVLHDLAQLPAHPAPAGVQVIVSGHSHRPLVQQQDGVLYVNPGSAGPRRFSLPITAAQLWVEGGCVTAQIQELAP